ncbi:hypothetical protein ACQPT2_04290 [Erwinia amylovora]
MKGSDVTSDIDLDVTYPGGWGNIDPEWLQPVKATYNTENSVYNVEMISPLPNAFHVSYSYGVKGRDSGKVYVSVSDTAMSGLRSVKFEFQDEQRADASYEVYFSCADIDNPDDPQSSASGEAVIKAYSGKQE